jgi:hypothetical protein
MTVFGSRIYSGGRAMTTGSSQKKKDGINAAKEWVKTATIQEQIDVAGCEFEYGETLDELISGGKRVPHSDDKDFSWGFFQQVKSRVHHKMAQSKPKLRDASKP